MKLKDIILFYLESRDGTATLSQLAVEYENFVKILGMKQTGATGMAMSPGASPSKQFLRMELDIEKRIIAEVLKNRIRIKEFFLDFDRLRKGFVGEAGVIHSYVSLF